MVISQLISNIINTNEHIYLSFFKKYQNESIQILIYTFSKKRDLCAGEIAIAKLCFQRSIMNSEDPICKK